MFDYFPDGYGLVTQHDPITENCNLFYAEYLELRKRNEYFDSAFKVIELSRFHYNMYLKHNQKFGVFNRRGKEDKRSVSHDEITGWLVASKILGTGHGRDIWKHLIKHGGSYNNTGRLLDYLPFNPSNYYAWGQLVDSKLSYFFLPFYMVNLAIASSKPKENTSSKIIYWLELQNLPDTFINRKLKEYYQEKMNNQYGRDWLKSLFGIYFNSEDKLNFPIFKELKWAGSNG